MTSSTLRFIFDKLLKQWLTGGKRGEDRNTKFDYLKNEKSFLDEINNYKNLNISRTKRAF